MQNVVINMCEKFHYDRLRNDRALGNVRSNNKNKNNNKNNVYRHCGECGLVFGSKNVEKIRNIKNSFLYIKKVFFKVYYNCGCR